eukprot:1158301-Pelagomonas_calceolata.AAC.6
MDPATRRVSSAYAIYLFSVLPLSWIVIESHKLIFHCNETVALGHKDQAKTGGWMPLWQLPIPVLRNEGTYTPGFLRTLSVLTLDIFSSAGSFHLARHPA